MSHLLMSNFDDFIEMFGNDLLKNGALNNLKIQKIPLTSFSYNGILH